MSSPQSNYQGLTESPDSGNVTKLAIRRKAAREITFRFPAAEDSLAVTSNFFEVGVRRRLTVSAVMNITDDEGFPETRDEHGTAQGTNEVVVTDAVPQGVIEMAGRVGGEVRVELLLTAQALTNEDVRIFGRARLFEGTSTESGDLDGERNFQVLVPRDSFTQHTVQVVNDDEGGDHAEITMNFSNRAV